MKKAVAIPLAMLSALLAYYGVGYALAAHHASECEEIAFQEAVQKRISGFMIGRNKVTVQRSSVRSSISPFTVEVSYSVPRDLHATVFIRRFHISAFGSITSEKLQIVYLV